MGNTPWNVNGFALLRPNAPDKDVAAYRFNAQDELNDQRWSERKLRAIS
jgi:hypothetical protein